MSCFPVNPAISRYHLRLVSTMVVYVVFLISSTLIFKHMHPVGIIAYALALLPALPIIGVIIIVGIYLAEEKDEFLRNLLIQSMLWGIGVVLTLATAWGFLELFTTVPHLQIYLAFPLFWFVVGMANPILRRRYR